MYVQFDSSLLSDVASLRLILDFERSAGEVVELALVVPTVDNLLLLSNSSLQRI